jgi:hypothetical protein
VVLIHNSRADFGSKTFLLKLVGVVSLVLVIIAAIINFSVSISVGNILNISV